MANGDVIGTMTIEAIDNGTAHPTPRVSFANVGRLTSGWHNMHSPFIEREIERAQAQARLNVTTAAATPSPSRRRSA